MNYKKHNALFVLASILIYLLSLFFLGFETDLMDDHYGWVALGFGWMALFCSWANLTWLANPILLFSWISIRYSKPSFIASLIATLISLSFLCFDYVSDGPPVGENEYHSEPRQLEIYSYGAGYFLWLLSSLIMCIGNYLNLEKKHKEWLNNYIQKLYVFFPRKITLTLAGILIGTLLVYFLFIRDYRVSKSDFHGQYGLQDSSVNAKLYIHPDGYYYIDYPPHDEQYAAKLSGTWREIRGGRYILESGIRVKPTRKFFGAKMIIVNEKILHPKCRYCSGNLTFIEIEEAIDSTANN